MNSTGWAVLSVDKDGIVRYVDSGVIIANTELSHGQRLREQRNKFEEILLKYNPTHIAREAGFSRHIKSTQVLFKAYGVAEEFFAEKDLVEYSAATIKKYTTGKGKASKEEVEAAIRKALNMASFKFKTDDESDAVAVALTHLIKLGAYRK